MTEKLIIIGSGPGGLTAAIYASRANLEPLLFEGFQSGGSAGGQLVTTGVVENYPGFAQGIDGQQLVAAMREQAVRFGTRTEMDDINEVTVSSGTPFSVRTANGASHQARALIVATGAIARRLPLESEKRLWGRGISACAVCDGALPVFRNKPLAVIGGGDTAVEEALHLSMFGSHVFLIHRRGELRASQIMRKRVEENPKITVLWNKIVEEFLGETLLGALKLKDTKTGEISDLQVSGAFEAIGHVPNTAFLGGQLALDAVGYIKTTPGSTVTSVPGIFAAGDVQDPKYRQAITAAGSGCMAALEAEKWLVEQGG